MKHARRIAFTALFLATALVGAPQGVSIAQENPPPKPIDLPCATNASSQVLGITPVNDGAQNMVLARVIIGPGGSVGEHTHPGTLIVTVEAGTLGFTHLGDSPMSVNRAATVGTESVSEDLPHGEEVPLNPGDWFVETGMIHTAVNLSDKQTSVLLSGLIEPGQPLTSCVDTATPASDAGQLF